MLSNYKHITTPAGLKEAVLRGNVLPKSWSAGIEQWVSTIGATPRVLGRCNPVPSCQLTVGGRYLARLCVLAATGCFPATSATLPSILIN